VEKEIMADEKKWLLQRIKVSGRIEKEERDVFKSHTEAYWPFETEQK